MRKVLVVEDEPKIANMERDFLEGAGFEPYVTDNGEEALKIMDEVKIDAIILDVMLPGEDGFSLCRKMREKTDAPIIFATARTEDADIVRGLGLGADDYIVKPFKGTVLMAHLSSARYPQPSPQQRPCKTAGGKRHYRRRCHHLSESPPGTPERQGRHTDRQGIRPPLLPRPASE